MCMEPKAKTDWLSAGIQHLNDLCVQARSLADDGDIVPTDEVKLAAVEQLKKFHLHRHPT